VIDHRAAGRRREHYAALLACLGHVVPEPFRELRDGAVPIAFPVQVESPRSLGSALAGEGIDSGFLWPTWHPTLPVDRYPIARHFREKVLAVPVHQELTLADVARIADAIQRWLDRR
jgi:dTDP-4-amino-4,6-dideoxygalactose transaminase